MVKADQGWGPAEVRVAAQQELRLGPCLAEGNDVGVAGELIKVEGQI